VHQLVAFFFAGWLVACELGQVGERAEDVDFVV